MDSFRTQDVIQLTDNIEITLTHRYRLNANDIDTYEINADDGGVGRATITLLQKRGWRVNRILNQSASKNKKNYRNRGAELWYKFARLVEDQLVILLDDQKTFEQISSRKFKVSTSGLDKLQLESKKDSMATGAGSPDRGDAVVLAFAKVNIEQMLSRKQIADESNEVKPIRRQQTYDELESLLESMQGGHSSRKVRRLINYSAKELVEKEHRNSRMLTR
jgi:hypothetical protein